MIKSDEQLDITGFKEQPAEDLKKAIADATEKRNSLIIMGTLPSFILMRQDQYDLLETDPDMQGMYGGDNRLFVTPACIMEVRVSGHHKKPGEMLGLKDVE